jgi:RHS repeat-associated protein
MCESTDANGNLTEQGSSYTGTEDSLTIAMSEDYRQYRYDLLNRLTEVLRYQDGNLVIVARYGYDINSLRIYKEDGQGITTHYVYDATGNRLETHTEETSSYYIFRGLRHVARRIVDNATQTEVRHYYGTDHLGSTVLVTGEAGEVLWTGETNPFGDSVSGEGTGSGESERIKYTGKDWDEDAGLYYFNARWYDPGTGRFITEDPARDGISWYVYVSNNPLKFTDPSGLVQVEGTDLDRRVGISSFNLPQGYGGYQEQYYDRDTHTIREYTEPPIYREFTVEGKTKWEAEEIGMSIEHSDFIPIGASAANVRITNTETGVSFTQIYVYWIEPVYEEGAKDNISFDTSGYTLVSLGIAGSKTVAYLPDGYSKNDVINSYRGAFDLLLLEANVGPISAAGGAVVSEPDASDQYTGFAWSFSATVGASLPLGLKSIRVNYELPEKLAND